ncbi:unnamed protein product [Polarella glacialis]|nr:unnamed protein product [Polarella glacialis]
MRLAEVADFRRLVLQFPSHGAGAKIRGAFRTRVAELLSAVGHAALAQAADALALVHDVDDGSSSSRGFCWSKTSAISRLEPLLCPHKALEDRIGKLAIQGRKDVSLLASCLQVASGLQERGLVREHLPSAVSKQLLRWSESVQLTELRRLQPVLRRVVEIEPLMRSWLEQRLVRRAAQGFQLCPGQLGGFAQLLLDIQESLRPLDGPGVPVLDPPSVYYLPPLRLAVLDALRLVLLRWPMERLANEFRGPVISLCQAFPLDIGVQVRLAVSARTVLELEACAETVLMEGDCVYLQERLLRWATFAGCAAAEGFLCPGPVPLAQLLGGPLVQASVAFCTAAVTPGCAEMPSGFKGHIPQLRVRSLELLDAMAVVKRHLLMQCSDIEAAEGNRG